MGLVLTMFGCGTNMYEYHHNSPESNYQSPREIPVYIDKNFTDKEKAALLGSTKEWNWALNGYIRLSVKTMSFDLETQAGKETFKRIKDTGEGYLIVKLDHDDPLLNDTIDEDDGTLAFVNRIGTGHIMVVLGDRIGTRDLRAITLHEYGHLLGAMHTMAKSLMFPAYGGGSSYRCIDKTTILQICNFQKIDCAHMNYCATPNQE